jgi:hypothetical protein
MGLSHQVITSLAGGLLCSACSKDATDTASNDTDTTHNTYEFSSKFVDGASSVDNAEPIMHHLVVAEMKAHLGALTARIDSGWYPESGAVADELGFFLDFNPQLHESSALASVPDNAEQTQINDISSEHSLAESIAGTDLDSNHRDWSTDFKGWEQEGVTTPESLIRIWINEIDQAAMARAYDGADTSTAVYVSADGVDRKQLLAKFLIGAATFAPGVDNALDDSVDGMGLLSDNEQPLTEDRPYTALEHSWDAGFACFGANRTYGSMTTDDIVEIGWYDANMDEIIDLESEFVWGGGVTTAKRDLGAVEKTQFSADAWTGLIGGRSIIAASDGALSEDDFAELVAFRDLAVGAWEAAVAATVVHYINAILQDVDTHNTDDYDLSRVAKHWSEAKGYGLWFQFNPNSPLDEGNFAVLHDALGTAPRLPDAGDEAIDAWKLELVDARGVLASAFDFDAVNVGDELGQNGW